MVAAGQHAFSTVSRHASGVSGSVGRRGRGRCGHGPAPFSRLARVFLRDDGKVPARGLLQKCSGVGVQGSGEGQVQAEAAADHAGHRHVRERLQVLVFRARVKLKFNTFQLCQYTPSGSGTSPNILRAARVTTAP
jgi:hypothetical protein